MINPFYSIKIASNFNSCLNSYLRSYFRSFSFVGYFSLILTILNLTWCFLCSFPMLLLVILFLVPLKNIALLIPLNVIFLLIFFVIFVFMNLLVPAYQILFFLMSLLLIIPLNGNMVPMASLFALFSLLPSFLFSSSFFVGSSSGVFFLYRGATQHQQHFLFCFSGGRGE